MCLNMYDLSVYTNISYFHSFFNRKQIIKQFFTKRKEEKSMKTKAVRLYGVNDLRLDEFELPEIKEDEVQYYDTTYDGFNITNTYNEKDKTPDTGMPDEYDRYRTTLIGSVCGIFAALLVLILGKKKEQGE